MIHRAVLGSVERFFATLLEYHGGNLPLWLAPVQVMLIPITDAQLDYAREVEEKLNAAGFRCELDARSEKMATKSGKQR
jgi:threonyl-tRNA synthetase